jgi:hypothetical protein
MWQLHRSQVAVYVASEILHAVRMRQPRRARFDDPSDCIDALAPGMRCSRRADKHFDTQRLRKFGGQITRLMQPKREEASAFLYYEHGVKCGARIAGSQMSNFRRRRRLMV